MFAKGMYEVSKATSAEPKQDVKTRMQNLQNSEMKITTITVTKCCGAEETLMSVRYHVLSPFIAIKPLQDGYKIVTIPSGCTIEVSGEVQRSGLVDVAFEGETVAVFMRDIEGRTERVD